MKNFIIRIPCVVLIGTLALPAIGIRDASAQPEIRSYANPVVTVPMVSDNQIVADGRVTDPEWTRASHFGDFLVVQRLAGDNDEALMRRAARNTRLHMQASKTGLQLAAIAERDSRVDMKNSVLAEDRDGSVWDDDSLEFIIYNVEADRGVVLIINGNGALFDGEFRRNPDGEPSVGSELTLPPKTFGASIDHTTWSSEIVVPWSALGGRPSSGDRWRFNVKRYEQGGVLSAWSPARDIAGIETSGTIRFSKDVLVQTSFRIPSGSAAVVTDVIPPVQVGVQAIHLDQNEKQYSAYVEMMSSAANGSGNNNGPEAVYEMPEVLTSMGFSGTRFEVSNVPDGEGSMGGSAILTADDAEMGVVATYVPVAGADNVARLLFSDDGTFDDPLLSQIVPFVWSEPVAFEVAIKRWILTNGTIELQVPPGSLPEYLTDANEVVAILTSDKNGEPGLVARGGLSEEPIVLDVSAVLPGMYRLTVELRQDGDVLAEREIELRIPEKPVWADNDLGYFEGVLPPWEPIAFNGGSAVTTNRVYDFGDSVFPQQITVRLDRGEQKLLSEPIRLMVDGKAMMPTTPAKVVKNSVDQLVLEQEMGAGSLRVSVRNTLEYDGYSYFEVEAVRGGAVPSLALEVPMRSVAATHYWRGYRGLKPIDQMSKADWPWGGRLQDEPLSLAFASSVRVHDLDHGLELNFEQDWDWKNNQPNAKYVIEQAEAEQRVLRINFVDHPSEVVAGSRFDFGMAALPLKPFELLWDEHMLGGSSGIADGIHFQQVDAARDPALWLPGREVPDAIRPGVFVRYPLRNSIDPLKGAIQLSFQTLEADRHDLLWLDFGDLAQNQGLHARLESSRDGKRLVLEDSSGIRAATAPVPNATEIQIAWQQIDGGTQFTAAFGHQKTSLTIDRSPTADQLRDGVLLLGGDTRIELDRLALLDGSGKWRFNDTFSETFGPNDYLATKAGGVVDRVASFADEKLILDVQVEMLAHEVNARLGMTGVYNHWHARDDFLGPWYEIDGPEREERYRKYHETVGPTGVGNLPYFLKNISINDPAWEDFGAEIAIQPTAISFDHSVVAPSGPGQDFTVWGVHKMLTDMQADYIHLDFGLPFPDASLGTGAGSIGSDGELRFSYPHLAHRAMFKRIYKLCLDHDAHFVPHTTPGLEAAYGGFATAGVTGEQEEFYFDFDYEPLYTRPVRSFLSDDRYLSHYPGILIGTPHYQLSARYLSVLTGDVLLNWASYWTMPYGDWPGSEDGEAGGHLKRDGKFVPYAAAAEQKLTTGSMMTRLAPYHPPVLKDFGDADFIPFFSNTSTVVSEQHDGDIVTSIARKTDGSEALLIVGNLTHRNLDTTLRVDREALSVGSDIEIYDPLMRDVRGLNADGEFDLFVPHEIVRLLIARPTTASR